MTAYFDNAATTPLDPEVLEAMLPFLTQHYGNPSSVHGPGRQVRAAIENARKTVAHLLNASPAEISFTSGGTEADNYAAFGSIRTLGLRHAVTSRLEHHAVLHPLQALAKSGETELSYLRHDERGTLDLSHLEELLASQPRSFVSLMHANNEIGNLNDIAAIGEICARHDAVFHTDTVQTMGHYRHDVQQLKNQFLVGSAHKFHGPKGVGFLYCRGGLRVQPLIHGGSQERNVRSGTENVYGIVGLAKALEIACRDLAAHQQHVQSLKDRFISQLCQQIDGVQFNGCSAEARPQPLHRAECQPAAIRHQRDVAFQPGHQQSSRVGRLGLHQRGAGRLARARSPGLRPDPGHGALLNEQAEHRGGSRLRRGATSETV